MTMDETTLIGVMIDCISIGLIEILKKERNN